MILLKPAAELLNVLGVTRYALLLLLISLVLGSALAFNVSQLTGVGLTFLLAYFAISGFVILAKDLQSLSVTISDTELDTHKPEPRLFQGRLGSLNNDILEALSRQRRTRDLFNNTLSEISYSSSELRETSGSLANNIQEQSNSTVSIAAAVTEISYSIDEIASRIQTASEFADLNKVRGREGQAAISEVRSNMNDVANFIDTTSQQLTNLDMHTANVSSISAVIRDIAEQTNLLALNAAIEAARAGEHGRGFSVVADEVRVLANRSHTLAQEITSNIAQVQQNMHEVTDSMGQVIQRTNATLSLSAAAENVLEDIASNSQSISEMISAIADGVGQQNEATKEISSNIERVAEVAAQNNHMAQQSSLVAAHLNELCRPGGQLDV